MQTRIISIAHNSLEELAKAFVVFPSSNLHFSWVIFMHVSNHCTTTCSLFGFALKVISSCVFSCYSKLNTSTKEIVYEV